MSTRHKAAARQTVLALYLALADPASKPAKKAEDSSLGIGISSSKGRIPSILVKNRRYVLLNGAFALMELWNDPNSASATRLTVL